MSSETVESPVVKKVPLIKVDTLTGVGGAFSATVAVAGNEPFNYTVSADHPLYSDFAQFGFVTKVRNILAMSEEKKKALTPEIALEMVQKQLARFDEGEWNAERSANGEAQPSGGLLAQALANLSNKPLDVVRAHLASLGADAKERGKIHSAIRERADVVSEIAKIKIEAASKKAPVQVDLSALGL